MFRYAYVVLLAGLCASSALAADEGAYSTSQVSEQPVRSVAVQPVAAQPEAAQPVAPQSEVAQQPAPVQSEIAQQPAPVQPAPDPGKADRSGPIPFADLGTINGNETLTDAKADAQDRRLQVTGEIAGDDLILHMPPGTLMETLSLRSSSGLDMRHNALQSIARFDGNEVRIALADLGIDRSFDLSNLWVWGTGPESASLLQRVAMNAPAPAPQPVVESRPLNQPNMMSRSQDYQPNSF